LYDKSLKNPYSEAFTSKASINNLAPEDLTAYKDADGENVNLHQGACTYADAIITGTEEAANVIPKLDESKKPVLAFQQEEEYLAAYLGFYNSLMEQEVE